MPFASSAVNVYAKTKSIVPRVHGPLEATWCGHERAVPEVSTELVGPELHPALSPETLLSDACPERSELPGLLELYDLGSASEHSAQPLPAGVRRLAQRLVSDPRFELAFAFLVLVNILVTALEVDHGDSAPSVFSVLNVLFAVAFTLEVIVRSYGTPHCDSLLLFDILIVAVSVFEVALLDQIGRGGSNLSYLLALRIFRLLRVLRIARFMRFEVLRVLTEAICRSAQPLAVVFLLIVLLLFSFSLALTTLLPLLPELDASLLQRYGSVSRSMVTLIQATAGVDEWAEALWPLSSSWTGWSAIFVLAIFAAVLTLHLGAAGLLAGVFLDQLFAVSGSHDQLRYEQQMRQHHRMLRQLDERLAQLGFSASDQVCWADIAPALQDVSLGVSVEVAERLFQHLGTDTVLVDDFLFGLFKLRTITKSVDMLSIDYQQEKTLRRISELQASARLALANVQARLSPLHRTLLQLQVRVAELRGELLQLLELRAKLRQVLHSTEELRPAKTLQADYALGKRLNSLEELQRRASTTSGEMVANLSALVVRKLHHCISDQLQEL